MCSPRLTTPSSSAFNLKAWEPCLFFPKSPQNSFYSSTAFRVKAWCGDTDSVDFVLQKETTQNGISPKYGHSLPLRHHHLWTLILHLTWWVAWPFFLTGDWPWLILRNRHRFAGALGTQLTGFTFSPLKKNKIKSHVCLLCSLPPSPMINTVD